MKEVGIGQYPTNQPALLQAGSMNKSSLQQHSPAARLRSSEGGFALVITLSLMLLLTVIAVGLLSLSAIELRTTSEGTARAMAMANARLALVLAIGDLQQKLGPDRCITASASLATKTAPLGVTGAWESWNTKELGTTYDKSGKFRGWLTSASLANTAEQPDQPPHVVPDSPGSVLLLGNGSLGKRPALIGDEMRIAMPKIPATNGRDHGNLAWVAIDESAKARLDLHRDHALPAAIAQIATAGAPAADGVFALADLTKFRPDAATSAKMITFDTACLTPGAASLPTYSPDLSNWSLSLLTDPVAGDFKKDLSTLFARGLTPAEASKPLYAGAGLATGPTDPPLSLLAGYHDLYKRLGVAVGGTQPGPDGVVASAPTGYAASTTPAVPTGPLLLPSLLRVDMIFSLISHYTHAGNAAALAALGFPYRLYLMYLPIITIHNPYNVPLVFDSLKISFADVPIAFQFRIGGQPLTYDPLPLNWLYSGQYGKTNSKAFYIRLKSAIGGTTPIRLEAGQTKLFGTPMVTPDWTWGQDFFDAKNGGTTLCDWWNGQTGEPNNPFEMAPTLITQSTTTAFGFTIDNIIPSQDQTPLAMDEYTPLNAGSNVALRPNTDIGVLYQPYMLVGSSFKVSMELTSGGKVFPAGVIEVNFGTQQRLKEVLEQGSSLRFPDPRTFPQIFPNPLVDGTISTLDIFEANDTKVVDYASAKPFVIFSLSGRTTMESFYRSRPYADGSPAVNAAKFDLSPGKDQPADLPFEMVMMPIRNNTAAIEEVRNKEEGFFFGGNGSMFGTPCATFYEFPKIPLQSLASFRHANLASSGAPPYTTYTVGESRAHPLIPTTVTQSTYAPSGAQMLDHTWLSNTALWDSHFLSTLTAYTGAAFGTTGKDAATVRSDFFKDGKPVINPRLVSLVTGKDAQRAIDRAAESDGWLDIASRLAIQGGFNVNSTSVEAWVAVLSSLRDESLSTVNGASATGNSAALPRVRQPSEAGIDDTKTRPIEPRWQGFRQLDETAIRRLATRVVAEIRSRGPFLSLSEFVNRRIGPASDERTHCGAVEAAIQKAKLNGLLADDGIDLNAGNLGTHAYPNPEVAYGPNTAAAPGALSQGDVLTLLGSRLTTRGDTFVIRTYGDATDYHGKILARAWCEAVVQRVPTRVDPADPPEKPTAQLNSVNQRFGRAFRLMSFRWLAPGEV